MAMPASPSVLANPFMPGLALALAVGMLIGVERGWQLRGEKAGARVAGIRTFALLGLLGGLAGTQMAGAGAPIAIVLLLGAIAALLVGYAADMKREGNVSATSALAAILTIGLGAMATTGGMALASVGAGALVILLASREPLHRAIRGTSEDDIKALLRLVLVVFVILPLLPDAGMGPFGALNPRRLWLVVVVTSAISFVGYLLASWLGQRRGTLVTAIVGALVSSTAVTLDSARRIGKGAPGPADNAAIALASAIMLGRALFLVALLAPLALEGFARLILPAVLVAVATGAGLVYWNRRSPDAIALPTAKPPGLGLAFLFALTVAALSIASAWAEARFGGAGGAIVIAAGGTADIDAAIAAVGSLPPGRLPVEVAALALAAPILFNTLFKLAILFAVARSRRALLGAAALAAVALALAAPIAAALR
jgi:uncharacterized membrane protein (DUF4010 family)